MFSHQVLLCDYSGKEQQNNVIKQAQAKHTVIMGTGLYTCYRAEHLFTIMCHYQPGTTTQTVVRSKKTTRVTSIKHDTTTPLLLSE